MINLMATVNRLYEFVMQATYAGQEIVNRWNYLGTGDDGLSNPSFGLATALGAAEAGTGFTTDSMLYHISGLQIDTLVYHQCLVRSVYVPTDFIDIPYPTPKPGLVTGVDGESPFVAIGFRSNRVRTDIGRGFKRFAGIPETEVTSLGIVSSALDELLASISTDLGASVSYTADSITWNYVPVIVGKEVVPATETTPKKYRYYATETLQAAHLASGIAWEPYTTVRSQVSRQYGKGK